MDDSFYKRALEYHKLNQPGKIKITPTKPLGNQIDLSLAYSPGVAAPCKEIVKNNTNVDLYTNRANTVAVISNGTAVLGLGNIGPLASKPVMEGKAVLFKKFAGIDAIDIEISQQDPEKLVDIIASLEPSFGAINLEDIKAPECFLIEQSLIKKMKIPVFHDDQHGTAIIVCAAILNALTVVNKKINDIKLVVSGAGSAAIASIQLLIEIGVKKQNIIICDAKGVVTKTRNDLNEYKSRYATDLPYYTLDEAIKGADVFLGVSVGNIFTAQMLMTMAKNPIVMALSNPYPEIDPELAKKIRPDVIIGTGRSDFPNQINNVLCFPFIFRGALDVGATEINSEMKKACVFALADLAKIEISDVVVNAYGVDNISFGKDYLIPKPFDPRLIIHLVPAVAKAAMDSGVATKPIDNFIHYKNELERYVYQSSVAMRPIFSIAKKHNKNIVYVDGENKKILHAAQTISDSGIGFPILVGNPDIIGEKLHQLKLRMELNKDFTLIDSKNNTCTSTKLSLASGMLNSNEVDNIICGFEGNYNDHLRQLINTIGVDKKYNTVASVSALNTEKGIKFIADGYVNSNPNAEELVKISSLVIDVAKYFNINPIVSIISNSNFGSFKNEGAQKMHIVANRLKEQFTNICIDGEMQIDIAINEKLRDTYFPHSSLNGESNIFITPNIESANIAISILKNFANAQHIGPILLGLKKSAHILPITTTVRGIVNMSAFSIIDSLNKSEQ